MNIIITISITISITMINVYIPAGEPRGAALRELRTHLCVCLWASVNVYL